MKFTILDTINDVEESEWNDLLSDGDPFIEHDFLLALEKGKCLAEYGWHPQYLLIHSDSNELIGACPAYLKDNSYGEFVFDWQWANAYSKLGKHYYPKLVSCIPYSPISGSRLLAKNNDPSIKSALIKFAIKHTNNLNLSSAHWLFCNEHDQDLLKNNNLLERIDYQFHWINNNYSNFDDFLSELTSKKRKNIRQERKKVDNADITIKTFTGDELSNDMWRHVYYFYSITFYKKSGTPTLSLDFFKGIKHKILVFMAFKNKEPIAAAICLKGKNTLYGRHWGCLEEFNSLHFELCYYTGIDYCINNKLLKFEPGAQGEHKISRGFLPQTTHSYHFVADSNFSNLLEQHLQHEIQAMQEYGIELEALTPFK